MLPRHRLGLLVLLSLLAAGFFLRLLGFRQQILGGDELHLVRGIVEHSPGFLLTHFETSDYCQPLAAFYRWVSDRGLSLDEVLLRLIPLTAGLALCLLSATWGVRRWGWLAGSVFVGLIALHPLFIYYSRIARPYMVVVLSLSIAMVSMERIVATGRAIWVAPLALFGALSVWFHIGVAPFAAGLCAAGLALSFGRAKRTRILALVGSMAIGTLLAIAILPSLSSLRQLLSQKSGARMPGLSALWESVLLLLGAPTSWLGAPLLILGAWGAWVLWRRARLVFWIAAAALAAQTASLWAFRPDQMHQPVLLARYQLVVVPVLLMAVALGVRDFAQRGLAWRIALGAAGILLLLGHPDLNPRFLNGGLQGQADHARFTRRQLQYPLDSIPAFYRELGTTLPAGTLLEAPWQPTWHWNRPFVALAAFHGQPILAAPGEEALFSTRFRWRNFVSPQADAALASEARYLVLHLDLAGEIVELAGGDRPRPSMHWKQGSRDPSELAADFEAAFGEPILSDEKTMVWDLSLLR